MNTSALLLLVLFIAAIPARPSIMTTAGYCWQSDGNPNLTQLIADDCSLNTGTTSASNSTTNSPTGFTSSESATASATTWHLNAEDMLTNYSSSLFQYSEVPNGSGGFIPFSTDQAGAFATLTDGITATGGTGTYSISFVFSVNGNLLTSGAAFGSLFSANLTLSQGTARIPQVMYCQASFCDGSTIPGTFTLTYSGLTYGQLNNLELMFTAASYVNPGVVMSGLLNGGSSADFADTVQLTDLLITDSGGNPVPDITLTSQNGYSYPLDHANTVPEPSMLLLLVMGGVGVLMRKRLMGPLRSREVEIVETIRRTGAGRADGR